VAEVLEATESISPLTRKNDIHRGNLISYWRESVTRANIQAFLTGPSYKLEPVEENIENTE
jgi:transposase-like protein